MAAAAAAAATMPPPLPRIKRVRNNTGGAIEPVPVVEEPVEFTRDHLVMCGIKCDVGASADDATRTRCHYARGWWLIPQRTSKTSAEVYVRGHRRHLCDVDALSYVGFCARCFTEIPKGTPPLLWTTPRALWGVAKELEPYVYVCLTCRPDEKGIAALPAGPDAEATSRKAATTKTVAFAAVAAMDRVKAAYAADVKAPPEEWWMLLCRMPVAHAVELLAPLFGDYKKSMESDLTKRWHLLFQQLALRILAVNGKKKKPPPLPPLPPSSL